MPGWLHHSFTGRKEKLLADSSWDQVGGALRGEEWEGWGGCSMTQQSFGGIEWPRRTGPLTRRSPAGISSFPLFPD